MCKAKMNTIAVPAMRKAGMPICICSSKTLPEIEEQYQHEDADQHREERDALAHAGSMRGVALRRIGTGPIGSSATNGVGALRQDAPARCPLNRRAIPKGVIQRH
jgi:hypothetical protein